MSRITYVFRNNTWVTKSIDGAITDEYAQLSPTIHSHGIITDNLPGGVNGMRNHADGKRYDSRSKYEQAVRSKGCRVVGNDWNNKPAFSRPPVKGDFNVKPALKDAVHKVLGV